MIKTSFEVFAGVTDHHQIQLDQNNGGEDHRVNTVSLFRDNDKELSANLSLYIQSHVCKETFTRNE